jgi:hypothetical protein
MSTGTIRPGTNLVDFRLYIQFSESGDNSMPISVVTNMLWNQYITKFVDLQGLDTSKDDGFCQGRRFPFGVGSGVKGAVRWRSSGPLRPLPTPSALGRERSGSSFLQLRSLAAWCFGSARTRMGSSVLLLSCVVVKVSEDSRPHPSVCGHSLRPGFTESNSRSAREAGCSLKIAAPYCGHVKPRASLRRGHPGAACGFRCAGATSSTGG